jgi:hypothetical protein
MPYLPCLEVCGIVTGPQTLIGALALLTPRLGDPLDEHLPYGKGSSYSIMDPSYVVLLAACLAAACCTLMVRACSRSEPDEVQLRVFPAPHNHNHAYSVHAFSRCTPLFLGLTLSCSLTLSFSPLAPFPFPLTLSFTDPLSHSASHPLFHAPYLRRLTTCSTATSALATSRSL